MSTKTDTLRDTLATLERKHKDAVERKGEITDGRARLAFAAHTTGKGAAALSDLREKAVRIDLEIDEVGAAVKTARAQLATAERKDKAEAMRDRARSALPAAKKIRDAGARAKKALADFGAALADIQAATTEARAAGVPIADANLFRVNLRRWIDGTLPLNVGGLRFSPTERQSIERMFEGYASGLEATVERITGARDDQLVRPPPPPKMDPRAAAMDPRSPPAYEVTCSDAELIQFINAQRQHESA